MYLFLAAAIGWAATPQGPWIGSTSAGGSAKIVVLDVRGAAVEGTLELQEDDGSFVSLLFAGRFEGGRLTAEGPGFSLSTTVEKAATDQPGSGEAWYGRGYVLSVLGRGPEANAALCRALGLADPNQAREIQGLLTSRRMSCQGP